MSKFPTYRIWWTDPSTPVMDVEATLWQGRDGSVQFTRDGAVVLYVSAHVVHHIKLIEGEETKSA